MDKLERYEHCLKCLCGAIKYDIEETIKSAKKKPEDVLLFGKMVAYSTFYKILSEQAEMLDIPLEELSMDKFKEEDFY